MDQQADNYFLLGSRIFCWLAVFFVMAGLDSAT
jgi:hypothetical protein